MTLLFPTAKFIEQGPLSAAIAEEFFGWKWMSFFGIPVRSHPDYPNKCRVRQFFSPLSLNDERWLKFWAENDGREAAGDEPLDYRYCSSMGPAVYPSYASDLNDCRLVEKEIKKRGLWDAYYFQLAAQCGAIRAGSTHVNAKKVHFSTPEQRCIAALAVINSKYVRPVETD